MVGLNVGVSSGQRVGGPAMLGRRVRTGGQNRGSGLGVQSAMPEGRGEDLARLG